MFKILLFTDQAKIKHVKDTFVDSGNIGIVFGHKESRKRDEYVKKIIVCLSYLIKKYLLNTYYMPGTMLFHKDIGIVMSKTGMVLILIELGI